MAAAANERWDSPVSPVPETPIQAAVSTNTSISTSSVKVASPDIIQVDNAVIPVELMQDLLFEDIGGQELLTIARHDMLSGQKVAYQPIKNIGDVSLQYNSDNIIYMPDSIKSYFNNFGIKLSDNAPDLFSEENLYTAPNMYIDSDNQSPTYGSLIVEFYGMSANQEVELQILGNASLFDDTIYTGTGN